MEIVQKADIKKQFRDVIFVEGEDGILVKYVRFKPTPKKQRSVQPPPPAPRAKSTKKAQRNAKAKPQPANRVSSSKRNVKQPSTFISPRLPRARLCKRKVNYASPLVSPQMTRAKSTKKAQQHAKPPTSPLPSVSAASSPEPVKSHDFVNCGVPLNAIDENGTFDVQLNQSGFSICLPDLGTIQISIPIWKCIFVNPLNQPMFVLGESWFMDLRSDGNLAVSLPEVNGTRETFLFAEHIWRNWIGIDKNESFTQPQEAIEEKSDSFDDCISLLGMNTSELAKLFGDIDMLTDHNHISIGSTNSMFEESQPNSDEHSAISGYDASFETTM